MEAVKTPLGLELSAFISFFLVLSSLFIFFLTGCLMVTKMVQDCNRFRLDEGGSSLFLLNS